jgi:hypothetical protein
MTLTARERRRVLVAISHERVAEGVVELLKLDRRYDVRGAAPIEAPAIARQWDAEAVLADAAAARLFPPEMAPRILVTAAGDGATANVAAAEIGAAMWVHVDSIPAGLSTFLREPPAITSRTRD